MLNLTVELDLNNGYDIETFKRQMINNHINEKYKQKILSERMNLVRKMLVTRGQPCEGSLSEFM